MHAACALLLDPCYTVAEVTASSKLSTRILRGSAWTVARQAVQQGCSLLSLIVVARLVPPAEVGLFSMAFLVLTVTRALTETGLDAALIARAELDEDVLSVSFWVAALRGLAVATVMALGAPLFAGFFGEPRVADLLRGLALAVFIDGLLNTRVTLFQRELDLHKHFVLHASGQVLGLCVTLVSAYVRRDVWAVVHGQIAMALSRVVASYVIAPGRPRLRFRWATLCELFSYGRWMSASSVLLWLLSNGDNVFVGKLSGAAELAYYGWGYQLASLPSVLLTQILSNVMFPALSSVRADRVRLSQLLRATMQVTWLCALPSALLIVALAEPFARAVLGERWLPIVPIARVLAASGVLRSLGASASALFLAVNRPDLRAKLNFSQLCLFASSVYPLYASFGVLGVAWSVTLYSALQCWAVVQAFHLCKLSVTSDGRSSLVTTAAAVAGAAVAYACVHMLGERAWLALICGSVLGALMTAISAAWLHRSGEWGGLVWSLRASKS